MNFRQFDKYFNALRREQVAERRGAIHTLNPAQLKQALKTGKIPPNLEVLMGAKEDGSPFTIEDLRHFDKARKQISRNYKSSSKGAPVAQLISASRAIDIQRANTEIQWARLYKVRGNLLHFNVTASGKHNAEYHQVRVRLENWTPEMTRSKSYRAGVKRSVEGPVSFDCGCGRHQFWYRYLATAGNFAVAPYEKDFPKVRNPSLTGCCCKHTLKAFKALQSPTVMQVLSKEMERQASAAGFAGDTRDKFIRKDEHDKLKRARPGDVSQIEAQKAYERLKQAEKAFKGQAKDKNYVKKLENELKRLREQVRKQKAKQADRKAKAAKAVKEKQATPTVDHDQLKIMLRQELDRAKLYGSSTDKALKVFAQINNVELKTVKELAKSL